MPHSRRWAEGGTPRQGPSWGNSSIAAHSLGPLVLREGPAGLSTKQTWGSAGLTEQQAQEGKRWQQVGDLFLPTALHKFYKR